MEALGIPRTSSTRTSRSTAGLHWASLLLEINCLQRSLRLRGLHTRLYRITDGTKSTTAPTRSMDYFKTMQNKETIHNKKHKFPGRTRVQYYLQTLSLIHI
eukprot:625230-Amphidinium_carterae.1